MYMLFKTRAFEEQGDFQYQLPCVVRIVRGGREQAAVDERTGDSAAAVLANKVLKYFNKTARRRVVFQTGIICWQLEHFVIGSVCDASHADEHCESRTEAKEVREERCREGHRDGGRISSFVAAWPTLFSCS